MEDLGPLGCGKISQYVTEAVARHFELDLIDELSALLHVGHEPLSDELLAEARQSWPDVQ